MKARRMSERYLFLFLLSTAVVIGLMVATWWFLRWFLGTWGDRASFGDMYGVTNTLFSGLAFALLVLTLLMQKEELSLQRQELQETREELARSAAAQEKSEQALNDQLEELIRQRRLSVMPAFVFTPGHRNQGTWPRLSNIGNGVALNVTINQLLFSDDGGQDLDISFEKLVYVEAKETPGVEPTWNGMEYGGEPYLQELVRHANKLYDETYDLIVNFQDIEGRAYRQILKMEKGHCVPQPVTAVT